MRPLSNKRKRGARSEGIPEEILVGEEFDDIADGTVDTGLVKLLQHQLVRVPENSEWEWVKARLILRWLPAAA